MEEIIASTNLERAIKELSGERYVIRMLLDERLYLIKRHNRWKRAWEWTYGALLAGASAWFWFYAVPHILRHLWRA